MAIERLGNWDRKYVGYKGRAMLYGEERPNSPMAKSGVLAGEWLNQPNIVTVEDWGCGYAGFRAYLGQHQKYIGIEGSKSPFADIITDLAAYRSSPDAIHLRHVLEHNFDWEVILDNLLASFKYRAVVTCFAPLIDGRSAEVICTRPNFQDSGVDMIDLSLPWEVIEEHMREYGVTIKHRHISSPTQYNAEDMYFLEKPHASIA